MAARKPALTRAGLLTIASWAGLFAFLVVSFAFSSFSSERSLLVRLFAMLGITCLFIASYCSAFTRQVYKHLGKPFLKVHHAFAIAGLVLITLHPVTLAIALANPAVFLPDFSSWDAFWRLAGRPALILIYVAIAVILLKKVFKKSWRVLHALVYVALFFGVVHGLLLGQAHASIVINVTYVAMLGFMIAALAWKRYQAAKIQRQRRAKATSNA